MFVSMMWHRHRLPERAVTESHAFRCRLPVQQEPPPIWTRAVVLARTPAHEVGESVHREAPPDQG